MSNIIKTFTKEQHYELQRNYIISKSVGLTNYNRGSDTRAILEAVADIAAFLGLDFLEGLRQSIPIALYTVFNYERKPSVSSSGALRFFRLPVFYIQYSGADGNVVLDISALQLTLTTSGTPADDVTVDFATFDTIDKVVAEIDSKTNWSAVKVQNGAVNDLYLYSSKQIISNSNYLLLSNSVDVMYNSAPLVSILAGSQVSVDANIFQTTANSSIPAGDSTSPAITSISTQRGESTNIEAKAIDTIEGKGYILTPITGVEHSINDQAFANGADEETNEERATRFEVFINGLHGGTKRGIEKDVLEIDGIVTSRLRERFPKDGINTIIADDGSGGLSAGLISEIQKVLQGDINDFENYPGKGVAGIQYNIEAPTVDEIDIEGTVYRIGVVADENEMLDAAKLNLTRYTNTRSFGDDVVYAELVALGKRSHPAVYDFKITALRKNGFPAALDNIPISDSNVARTEGITSAKVTLTMVTLSTIP